MSLVDANIILRYILWDHKDLAEKAKEIIEHEVIELPFEVIAEVVYVLEGVYGVERGEIQEGVLELLKYPNISTSAREVLQQAFQIFSAQKLDFVDALLVVYHKVNKAKVFSFDKKVTKLLDETPDSPK
jgi:predicted nucleic-acid-binding protein